MPLRCDLHVNGGQRKLIIGPRPEEPWDHVALRLASCVFFWDLDPKIELSLKHPALAGQEFRPDFICLSEAGEVALWGECGNVALNKLNKVTRRYPYARVVVLKASEAEGRKMRRDLEDGVDRAARVEVLSWRTADFAAWRGAVADLTEVFGEASEKSMNLVVNRVPLAAELVSH